MRQFGAAILSELSRLISNAFIPQKLSLIRFVIVVEFGLHDGSTLCGREEVDLNNDDPQIQIESLYDETLGLGF